MTSSFYTLSLLHIINGMDKFSFPPRLSKLSLDVLGGFHNVFSGSLSVSLNATGALVCMGKRNVMLGRPSIITVHRSHTNSPGDMTTMNRSTGRVLNHAPNGVTTVHPVGSNIVTSFFIARGVLRRFVGRIRDGDFVHPDPHILIYMPINTARIRHHTVHRSTRNTNTHRIFLVRRPVTTTVNTNLPISRTANSVIISVNNNAARITIVSLGNIICSSSIHVNNSHFSRTVVGCIHHGCNSLVNRTATRHVGRRVNSTCPNSRIHRVRIHNHGLTRNIPHNFALGSGRVLRTLRRPLANVIDTMVITLRRYPPRLTSSVSRHNVILANNNTLLHGLSHLLVRRANVPIIITRSPLAYITHNNNGTLRVVSVRNNSLFDRRWSSTNEKGIYLPYLI